MSSYHVRPFNESNGGLSANSLLIVVLAASAASEPQYGIESVYDSHKSNLSLDGTESFPFQKFVLSCRQVE